MLTDMLIRIALAGILGGLIGLERQMRAKEAGLRTHILVGIGSAMFMLVSKYGFSDMLNSDHVALDPSRIAAQVVSHGLPRRWHHHHPKTDRQGFDHSRRVMGDRGHWPGYR